MQGENLDAFVKIWNERLNDAIAYGNLKVEAKARSVIEFVTHRSSDDLILLLWGSSKLAAIYDDQTKKILLIE
jgi:hypothetical protein